MSDELKPCPFCGGEADVRYFAHDDSECTVMCSNPNCRASVSARSCGSMTTAYNRARELWNRRAERTATVEVSHGTHGPEPRFPGDAWTMHYVCSGCRGAVSRGDRYCKHCGARVVE